VCAEPGLVNRLDPVAGIHTGHGVERNASKPGTTRSRPARLFL